MPIMGIISMVTVMGITDRYDMHCHLLPGMDDGCKTVEESVEVLLASGRQGIIGICDTPHYYPEETAEHFLERRARAFHTLQEKIEEVHGTKANGPLPRICLGTEVAFHTGLVYEEKLDQLCYGHSHYLLLEMPFFSWSPNVLREVRSIHSVRGITPVIAHLERYLNIAGEGAIEELLSMHVMVQMNAGFLQGFWNRKKAIKMLKSGMVQVMGSDSHDMVKRPPNLGPALQYMESHGMLPIAEEIGRLSSRIFNEV